MLRLLRILLFMSFLDWAIADPCPGGQLRCPDEMTCCKLSGDSYGCCPFPQGKCCSDGVHCCPHDMECDAVHQTCVSTESSVQFGWQVRLHPEMITFIPPERKTKSRTIIKRLHQVTDSPNECPDKTCSEAFTCCKMFSGKYGCCPFRNGTCCQDGFRCCPHGTHCTDTGECYPTQINYTRKAYIMNKITRNIMKGEDFSGHPQQQVVSVSSNKCPDTTVCNDAFTCCKMFSGKYGCCPFRNGTCCQDGFHCCPHGFHCTASGSCYKRDSEQSFLSQPLKGLELVEASKEMENPSNSVERIPLENSICPDKKAKCPSKWTCCIVKSGKYGCCPLEMATCCPDKIHCCPHGYYCDYDECKMNLGVSLYQLILSTAASSSKGNKPSTATTHPRIIKNDLDEWCPDQSQCPDGNTCCPIASGGYGCCPYVDATCCDDKESCCPGGYMCVGDTCAPFPGKHHNNNTAFLRKQFSATKVSGVMLP